MANGLNFAQGLFLKDSQDKNYFYSVRIGGGWGGIGKQKICYGNYTWHVKASDTYSWDP